MENDRKISKILIAEADVDFNRSVNELIDAILQDMKEDYQSELEPFEHYAKRVRYEIYADVEKFRDRFVNGYITLIDQIKSMDNKKND